MGIDNPDHGFALVPWEGETRRMRIVRLKNMRVIECPYCNGLKPKGADECPSCGGRGWLIKVIGSFDGFIVGIDGTEDFYRRFAENSEEGESCGNG